MSAVPPPPAVPQPVRASQPVGCFPALVFLLIVIVAAGAVILRTGLLLPTEKAGRTVVQFLDSPSKEQMKAHATGMLAGNVLKRTFASAKAPEQLKENVEARVDGPFLTVTVYGEESAPGLAGKVVEQYLDELHRRLHDSLMDFEMRMKEQLSVLTADTQASRDLWIQELSNQKGANENLSGEEAGAREIAEALSRAKRDLLKVNQRVTVLKEQDVNKAAASLAGSRGADPALKTSCLNYLKLKAPGSGAAGDAVENARKALSVELEVSRAAANSEQQSLRTEVSALEGAMREQRKASTEQAFLRSKAERLKEQYEFSRAGMLAMQKNLSDRKAEVFVQKREAVIVEEAHAVEVPGRTARKIVRWTVLGSVVLLVALLGSALAARFCRRA